MLRAEWIKESLLFLEAPSERLLRCLERYRKGVGRWPRRSGTRNGLPQSRRPIFVVWRDWSARS